MKFLKKAVPIAAIVLSVAAIVLSSVSIAYANKNRVIDYFQASLSVSPFFSFFHDDIEEMYVENSTSPYECGYFYDEELLTQIRDLLKSAAFQKTNNQEISNNNNPGGAWAWITFKGKDHEYSISAGYNGIICLCVDDKRQHFYTNVGYELNLLLFEASRRPDLRK